MGLILDGNSEINADVRRNLCYLICFRDLIRPRAVTYRIYLYPKCPMWLPSVMNLFNAIPNVIKLR